MKSVIIGAGVVGTHLAKQLIAQGHEIVIVESNDSAALKLKNRLDCLVIHGEGNDLSVLEEAGVSNADFLITVTRSDELNLLMCGMVKTHKGKPNKIARIRNIRYSSPETYFDTFKVNFVINPEIEAAHTVIRSIKTHALGDVLEFTRTPLQIRNITIDRNSHICGQTVQSIIPLVEKKFLFSLIYRDSQYIIPNGDTVIREDDVLYIAAVSEDFKRIYRAFGISTKRVRRIVIAGGGKIGHAIANYILNPPRQRDTTSRIYQRFNKNILTIVENDHDRAQKLADEFPAALVIHGDISNNDLFIEENLSSAELLITATDNEEINLLSATYAKSIGIRRAIAVVSKAHYMVIAHKLKIDVTVSIKNTVVNAIINRIDRGHITSMHSLLDGMIKVLEFDIGIHSKILNKRLKDIPLPSQCIIITITRDTRSYIPRGDFTIRENDQIVVIVKEESSEELRKLIFGTSAA